MAPHRPLLCGSSLLVAALLWASPALAQRPAFELPQALLSPGGAATTGLNGASLLPHGTLRASLGAVFEYEPVVLTLPDQPGTVVPVEARLESHLVLAVAPLRRLQVSAQLPLILLQRGPDLSSAGVPAPTSFGFGAAMVRVRGGLASESSGDPLDAALDLDVSVPSAISTRPGAPRGWAFTPRAAVGTRAGLIRLEAAASVRLRPSFFVGDFKAGADWAGLDLGVVYAGQRFGTELAAALRWPLDGTPPQLELLPGVRYVINERFGVFLLGGPSIGPTPTFTFRVIAGVTFAEVVGSPARSFARAPESPVPTPPPPRVMTIGPPAPPADPSGPPPDSDHDGILDSSDLCPLEPGVVALRGCPETDTDGDGVLDGADKCVTDPGPVDRDGCPARDSDRDGVIDEADACPTQVGTVELRGCPGPTPAK